MDQERWEHFEHEADIGVRGYGSTLAGAFEQAAIAMMALITDVDLIEPRSSITLRCNDDDKGFLLTDWLNSLVYEMATRKWLFSRFKVELDGSMLTARAWGEPIDIGRHQPAVEIKGATFTELAVYQKDDYYVAQCVVDV